ncbi:hypothetical protein BDFG_08201 [Blastomyces dermatitidis ATCC 26199]|nr:hypothetical protein BDFG_08201 [Blastomyces dermatitidis ATCC 26199]
MIRPVVCGAAAETPGVGGVIGGGVSGQNRIWFSDAGERTLDGCEHANLIKPFRLRNL